MLEYIYRRKKYAYLGIYHVILFMLLWCFAKVALSDIGVVPNEFSVPSDLLDKILNADSNEMKHRLLLRYCEAKQITVVTRTSRGYIRFCRICKHIKPDRAHHCSSCQMCVLKMDHHCPRINNCVCLTNYKSFILLLFYLTLYSLFCFGTTLEYFFVSWTNSTKTFRDVQIMIAFSVFFVAYVIFLLFFIFHLLLLFANTTTLETLSKPVFCESSEDVSFNLGWRNNVNEVFEGGCICCCFPIEKATCDGVNFSLTYTNGN